MEMTSVSSRDKVFKIPCVMRDEGNYYARGSQVLFFYNSNTFTYKLTVSDNPGAKLLLFM